MGVGISQPGEQARNLRPAPTVPSHGQPAYRPRAHPPASMGSMTQPGEQARGKVLTRSEATAHGGRNGYIETPDHHLGVKFSVPQEIGGDGGVGTNPEQLFAAALAASFQSAVGMVARRDGVTFGTSQVTGVVGLRREDDADPSYHLDVELRVSLPGLGREEAERMVREARALCPYCRALGDSADVRITVEEETGAEEFSGRS